MLLLLFAGAIIVFILGYVFYGRFLEKKYDISDAREVPSETNNDGVDYVPTKPLVLLGHHFSSIAGASPIIGAIVAGLAFGWLPAYLWIVLGTVLIGGVHDFSSLVVSIRHDARSIAYVIKSNLSKLSYHVFLIFVLFFLVYVMIVFLDLTAEALAGFGDVATASLWYIGLAVVFGQVLKHTRLPFWLLTVVFVSLVFGGLFFGMQLPINNTILAGVGQSLFGGAVTAQHMWALILTVYVFIASLLPVWVLLQPRDYLSSFLLFASVLIGVVGIILVGGIINYDAVLTGASVDTFLHSIRETLGARGDVNQQGISAIIHSLTSIFRIGPIFPVLFITIACGAVSGFHSIVASGTTAKQLMKESHARHIGYGGMVIESILALIALATVMVLSKNDIASIVTDGMIAHNMEWKFKATSIFARGLGMFLERLHVPPAISFSFALLAISTFLLTTLDTTARLSRYVITELLHIPVKSAWKYPLTLGIVVIPLITVLQRVTIPGTDTVIPIWQSIWPAFGATNQLLAALALMIISLWLFSRKKPTWYIDIPMIFMAIVTVIALVRLILSRGFSDTFSCAISIIALILLVLTAILFTEMVLYRLFGVRFGKKEHIETTGM